MAQSTGLNAESGKTSTDWEHAQQSIRKILTTRLNTRVMRRDFGSLVPDLVDQKMVPKNILLVYSAAAEAIDKWEPRFRMLLGSVIAADATGAIQLVLYGTYYPRGHLGDYSIAEARDTTVIFPG